MTIEQLLREIRHIAERDPTDSPSVRKKLTALANRPGAAELLATAVRTGEPLIAQTAALALPFARSELVRRALVLGARRESGERRLNYLAALQPEELQQVLAETGGVAADDLVEAAGLLAMNSPGEFVEVLCEGAPLVDLSMVEHVERVRRRFAIRAAALYGPLLDRKMSPDARQRTFAILGREGGEEVRHLLEKAQQRLTGDADKTSLRREQLRQATLSAEGRVASAREGIAVLHPVDGAGEIVLEILEVSESRVLQSTVKIGPGAPSHVTAPADGDLESTVQHVAGSKGVRISLGNARSFLETIPQRRRMKLAALLDRLGDTPAEDLVHPQPGAEMSLPEARQLVVDPVWRDWRPFLRFITWSASTLLQVRAPTAETFPLPFEEIEAFAGRDAGHVLKRRAPAALNSELRHMALLLHLRGDARAGAVAAETIAVERRRPSVLLKALAERERWRQLWAHAPLPDDYRAQVRDQIRRALGDAPPSWREVKLLDLAQAVMEGAARDFGELGFTPGLPPVEQLPLPAALRFAEHAASVLEDPELRRFHARIGREESLARESLVWGDALPPGSLFEIAQFVEGVCCGACPHRCFEQTPAADPAEVFRAEIPVGNS
jgi:hypothetical protein